jgi:glycosyltransferase involved in cell wall biosynthesis
MIAHVANRDLNSRGGSARVCLSIIKLLKNRGFAVKLLTKTPLNWKEISQWNGEPLAFDNVASIEPVNIRSFQRYQKFLDYLPFLSKPPDLFVNTSGDFLPFLHYHNGRNVAYCHFPVVRLLRSEDIPEKYKHGLWRLYFLSYRSLLNSAISRAVKQTFFITNSYFSKMAIRKYLGVDAEVIYPPVAVERFRSVIDSKMRQERIVTLVRFDPSKNIEIIFDIIRELPNHIEWDILGSLSPKNFQYFRMLRRKSEILGLSKKIFFHPNAPEEKVLASFANSKVYFHPTRGEHFGISIVEAMAAGLIPIVWNYGGSSEIVPIQYQFSRKEEAAEKIVKAMDLASKDGDSLSEMATRFSETRFHCEMWKIFKKVIADKVSDRIPSGH